MFINKLTLWLIDSATYMLIKINVLVVNFLFVSNKIGYELYSVHVHGLAIK